MPTNRRIGKLWHSYTMEHYLAIKKELTTHIGNNMNESQKHKAD